MSELIPCSGCQRHVQANEAACPFCGATLSKVNPCNGRCSGPTAARVAKAALVAAGAAILGVGCSSVTPPYGGVPIFDAGTQSHPDAGDATDSAPDAKDGSK